MEPESGLFSSAASRAPSGQTELVLNPPLYNYMCLAPNDLLISGNRPPSRTEDASAPEADCNQGKNENTTNVRIKI